MKPARAFIRPNLVRVQSANTISHETAYSIDPGIIKLLRTEVLVTDFRTRPNVTFSITISFLPTPIRAGDNVRSSVIKKRIKIVPTDNTCATFIRHRISPIQDRVKIETNRTRVRWSSGDFTEFQIPINDRNNQEKFANS